MTFPITLLSSDIVFVVCLTILIICYNRNSRLKKKTVQETIKSTKRSSSHAETDIVGRTKKPTAFTQPVEKTPAKKKLPEETPKEKMSSKKESEPTKGEKVSLFIEFEEFSRFNKFKTFNEHSELSS